MNVPQYSADLQNRVILLTGAAGVIGAELARHIALSRPARLVLLDRSERNLSSIQDQLSETHPDLNVVAVICDITNAARLGQVCAQHRPDYVIHSAGYQHVSLMESNASEAVRNNVLGTLLVATTAVRYGTRKMLLLSDLDAVRPSSVVAATKHIGERILFGFPNLHRSGTDFRVVRFGRVPPHSGPIADAVQLILQAGSLAVTTGAIATLETAVPGHIAGWAGKLLHLTEETGPELGQKLSRLFSHLDDDDDEALLQTLCELVPDCIAPLADHGRDRRPEVQSRLLPGRLEVWPLNVTAGEGSRRERRRAARFVPPAELHREERRQGVVCRRKEARAGGRRGTDTGVLLPQEGASAHGGARSEHSHV